ncbi:LytTR family DNA-binding domain-containing protein [Gemmatimonas sp.]|uniref:LytR/AlgR family response regulator transcription factor n=1 Tax=Gemmatimonas sp. TaxID=1962908 RepID=UPI00286AA2A2|nr:LytTR family DNA-binding domain-containing protein [Gemmatimonas sp.]
MRALRIVVADDEPIAAASLAAELQRLDCDVVAICANGESAIARCAALQPDACFTDVAMPERDGLAVARALREAAPGVRVVFVSAHPHFALEAYGADVVDFVLKPVRRARLADAVDRVRRAIGATDHDDRILVSEHGSVHVVPIREIEWVQADGYNLWLHTTRRAWLIRERMHRMEARLQSAGFLRVHRSALVRLSAIQSIEQAEPNEPTVVLRSGVKVKAARDRLNDIRNAL